MTAPNWPSGLFDMAWTLEKGEVFYLAAVRGTARPTQPPTQPTAPMSNDIPQVEMPDFTDLKLGDAQIIRRIGTGAMAEVYLADQRSLDRRIAVKILKPELAKDETYVTRFVREAKAAARLVHPNIVHIYEVDRNEEGIWYISQEYVQGVNLQLYVQKNGALSAKRTFEILWQVASALEKASHEGVVHRDIKPENILIGDSGDVKVADFGLARVMEQGDNESTRLTQIGMTLGTPLYMSPEQSEGKPTDQRSDIYSLGITTYFMLAGHPPFRGETALAVAIQHLKSDPEPLEIVRPDIPPMMARIVHRMIAKSPNNRYQSVRDLLHELKQLYSLHFAELFTPDELSDWNMLHLDSNDSLILASTERLQSIMSNERKLKEERAYKLKLTALAVILAAVIGGLAAFSQNKFAPSLLAPLPANTEFPKMETVAAQWVIAAQNDTEEGWYSVIHYYSDEVFWCDRAKQHLARIYMSEGDTYTASLIFQEFADMTDTETQYQGYGLAGLMWCSAREGNYAAAMGYYTWFLELKLDNYDPQTKYVLDAATNAMKGG